MTITPITIGGVGYVSYASVAEADDRLAIDPVRSAAWEVAPINTKGAHLVAATKRLDLLTWAGQRAATPDTQPNKWPRTGVTYPDGAVVSNSEVPIEVQDATILLAGSIALDSEQANAGRGGSNIRSVGAGSARVEFFKPVAGGPLQDETAFALIRGFLASNTAGLVGCASGTDGTSQFDEGYGLTEGYP